MTVPDFTGLVEARKSLNEAEAGPAAADKAPLFTPDNVVYLQGLMGETPLDGGAA